MHCLIDLLCSKHNFKKYYKQLITFSLHYFYIPFSFNVFSSAEILIKDTVKNTNFLKNFWTSHI